MSDRGSWSGRTATGVIWSTLAFVGTKSSTLITTIVLAHLLVPADFGLVAAVVVYVAIIELLSDLGMRATVVYEQEEGVSERVQSAYTANLIVAAGLTVLGIVLAPLAAAAFGMSDHTGLFRLAALNPLLTGFGNIHDGLLLRAMDFRRRIRPQLGRAIVRTVVSVALALLGAGASSLVIGMLVGTAVWSTMLWFEAPFRPSLRISRAHLASMAGYGSGAMALEVVAAVGVRADTFVIAQALGATALGLYAVAYRLPELLIENVMWSISDVAFPALAQQRRDDPEGMAAATLMLMRGTMLYAAPVGTGLAILGVPLVVVLFSEQWRAAGDVLSVVAVMCVFVAVSFPLGDLFKALGRQRTLVLVNTISIPLTIVAMIAATPGGLFAVAAARAAAGALNCLLITLLVMRTLRIAPRRVAHALAPAAAATAGTIVGTGGMRVVWPAEALLPLLAAIVAGLAVSALCVQLLTPDVARGVAELARDRLPRGRRRSPVEPRALR